MKSYKERFVTAVNYTKKLGLNPGETPVPWSNKLSINKAREIISLSRDIIYELGMTKSSDLATNCIGVHLELQNALYHFLRMKSYITIGDKYWSDFIYCEMSHASIEKELSSPAIGEDIRAHVWLTLRDGSILDCTGEAHLDLIFQREEHPIEENIFFIPPDKVIEEGYHRPYLVGPEFLIKAGVFTNPNA